MQKMMAWEQNYVDRVTTVRANEMSKVQTGGLMRGLNMSLFFSASAVISFVTFTTFFFTDEANFTAENIFVTLTLFSVLRVNVMLFIPFAVESGSEVLVTFRRLQAFLLLDEFNRDAKESASASATSSSADSAAPTSAQPSNGAGVSVAVDGKEQKEHKEPVVRLDKVWAWWSQQRYLKGNSQTAASTTSPSSTTAPAPTTAHSNGVSSNGKGRRSSKSTYGSTVSSFSGGREDEHAATLMDVSFSCAPRTLTCIIGPVGAGKSSILLACLSELVPSQGSVTTRGTTAFASQSSWVFSGSVRSNILMGLPYDEARYRRAVEACALDRDFEQWPYADGTIVGEKGITLSGGQRARVSLCRAVYADADIYLLDDPLSAVDTAVARHLFEKCIRGALRDKIVVLVTHQLQFVEKAEHIVVLRANGSVEAQGSFSELIKQGISFDVIRHALEEQAAHAAEEPADTKKAKVGSEEQSLAKEDQRSGGVGSHVFKEYFTAAGGGLAAAMLAVFAAAAQTALQLSDWYLAHWVQLSPDQRQKSINDVIYACLVIAAILLGSARSDFNLCLLCLTTCVFAAP